MMGVREEYKGKSKTLQSMTLKQQEKVEVKVGSGV